MAKSLLLRVVLSLGSVAALVAACPAQDAPATLLRAPVDDLDAFVAAYGPGIWELVIEEPSTENIRSGQWRIGPRGSRPAQQAIPNGYRLRWRELRRGDERLQITVEMDAVSRAGELHFTFRIDNQQPDCIVRQLRGPILRGFDTRGLELLWPDSLGRRARDLHRAHAKRLLYPGWASMQWMALQRNDQGLYLGSHDESFQTTGLDIDCHGGRWFEISITKFPICRSGDHWVSAPVVLMPYHGPWRRAADRYRRWAEETWWSDIERPQWVRNTSGIQLAILKQQNGEVLWDYSQIAALCDISRRSGLDALGLFGWTAQGHDHLYPYYDPDPDMGGAEQLEAALRRARQAGRHPFLYADGHRVDVATDFYREYGDECCVVDERGTHRMEYPLWRKYYNASPVATANACFGSERWRRLLVDQALQAHKLGASGILFDRIGGCEPYLCFHPAHDHAHPALATGPGKRRAVKQVRDRVKAIDPDFAVITELVTDCLCQHVDLIHGHGMGTSDQPGSFPEMFRYTFPEMIITQRHPTPILDRRMANFAVLYGLRHELEFRYAPDVRYMRYGTVPAWRDYIDVVNKPDIELMRTTDRDRAQAYLKALIDFEHRHRDLLREGRFVDAVGFEVQGESIRAKGFLSGRHLGVVVWNTGSTEREASVAAPGYTLQGAFAPLHGRVSPRAAIPPESIRLLRFRRGK